MQHQPVGPFRVLLPLLLAIILLAAGGAVAWATEDPGREALAGPDAAPNPPPISIEAASSSSIALLWEHIDQTATTYQVWRSEAPYFNPNAGQGTLIDAYIFSSGVYGLGTAFQYVDNGICGYFLVGTPPQQPKPCTAQSPTVTVRGDVAHNYFWVLRAGNGGGEFDFENRVGEFDYRLVKGG